ncbi:uncharacterized protein MELLADRAFT_123560 [Melampsora larici-populina 98AG31]|uniref:Secreted protein n=1 Tax=Melampsora larici-populina (strain 98AG31 / pathotype 3-4-7) TaxID=747676 RepID=F4RPM0_MELLP|nr:uncharacterized protein MELLADRAFT_123560 [Melampsora larici-populina 98AG31]EGG05559.1 secreted protein [Melampsora larici-populina 98AG31]
MFNLFLVVLLVGNLGSHMFVDANAFDCTYGWNIPKPGEKKYLCQSYTKNADPVYHYCDWCGRNDGLIPAAVDCVDPNGVLMAPKIKVLCNVAIYQGDGDRPIECLHRDPDHVVRTYHCATQVVFQQCPQDKCNTQNHANS